MADESTEQGEEVEVERTEEEERYLAERERRLANFTPDPTHQTGNMDTSGTTGDADSDIGVVAPVFDVHRAASLQQAAKAVDPEDDSTSESLVVLPDNDKDAARQRIAKAAQAASDSPENDETRERTTVDAEERASEDEGPDEGHDNEPEGPISGSAPQATETVVNPDADPEGNRPSQEQSDEVHVEGDLHVQDTDHTAHDES